MSYTNFSQVSKKSGFTQQTLISHNSMTKSQKVSILVSYPEWFFIDLQKVFDIIDHNILIKKCLY